MGLFIPSVFLYLLASPTQRYLLRRPGFWVMCGVALSCCLPILIWNAEHNWVTFNHLLALAGFGPAHADEPTDGPRFQLLGPLVYVGGQAALLLGFWFVTWVAAMYVYRPTVEKDPGLNYLWWMSAPMFVWFWAFSFKTGGGEVNWPVTAYLSGLVLASRWIQRQLESPSGWYRHWSRLNVATACTIGLAITLLLHHSEVVHPLLAKITGKPTASNRFPLRKLDPTCRLRGWRTLAAAVDEVRQRLQEEGAGEVFLVGVSWTTPGELGAYCKGNPRAYTFGPLAGDRHSQYDLWPGPLSQPEDFKGCTFLLIGDPIPNLAAGFDHVECGQEVVHYEHGRPISSWCLTVCRGFKGFPAPVQRGNF